MYMCGLVKVREHDHRTGDSCEGGGKLRAYWDGLY